MTKYYLGSSTSWVILTVVTRNLKTAKCAATRFYGNAACGHLTVSALICKGTNHEQFVELARKVGFGKWSANFATVIVGNHQ